MAEPETLHEEPGTAFVARFIGENNRLYGRVLSIENDICQVQIGEHMVQGVRIVSCQPGDDVTLSIRPERVAVAPRPGLYTNEFDALVKDITFVGDHLRIRVAACGRGDIVAKIPNMVGHGAVLDGDRIRIGWTPTDCRVLDASDAGDAV